MAAFANFLVTHPDGPVIDKTGIQGLYDFSLNRDEVPDPSHLRRLISRRTAYPVLPYIQHYWNNSDFS